MFNPRCRIFLIVSILSVTVPGMAWAEDQAKVGEHVTTQSRAAPQVAPGSALTVANTRAGARALARAKRYAAYRRWRAQRNYVNGSSPRYALILGIGS